MTSREVISTHIRYGQLLFRVFESLETIIWLLSDMFLMDSMRPQVNNNPSSFKISKT